MPHVTVGVGLKDYLDAMLAAPFEAFTFSPAGASVYQLGDFGTARKNLKTLDLHREPDRDLPSWNEGAAKAAILDFVRSTTDPSRPTFVAGRRPHRDVRSGRHDVGGASMYTQVAFALARLADLAPQHPEWKTTEPFKSTLAGDMAAFAKFTMNDLEQLVAATHAGMSDRRV